MTRLLASSFGLEKSDSMLFTLTFDSLDTILLGQVYHALESTGANLPQTCGTITTKKLSGERVSGGPHYLFQLVENGKMGRSTFASKSLRFICM